MHWSKLYKLNCTSLRLFNVYGTRSRTSGTYGAMFGVFLAQKLNRKPFTIVGDGNQKRDFTYVKDVVDAFIKASKLKKSGKVFNVGSGKTVSVNQVVAYLKEKSFIKKDQWKPDMTFAEIKKSKIKMVPQNYYNQRYKYSFRKFRLLEKSTCLDSKKITKETKSWFKYLK